jgi:glycosyltransferase involved in cell wall biosynthesis
VIAAVGVVVPARDEEQLLPGCLDALEVAAAHAGVPVWVVVVLDDCVDRSADVARRRPWVTSVVTAAGNVGVARGVGVREVRRHVGNVPATDVWLATTDADTAVPANWLSRQLELADEGWEVVVGTVAVDDWTAHPPEVQPRWSASYRAVDGHGHVHGANFGCTAAAYDAVGGWPPLASDEDVALLAALACHRVVRTASIPVLTSSRRDPRATGGFGDTLRGLAG